MVFSPDRGDGRGKTRPRGAGRILRAAAPLAAAVLLAAAALRFAVRPPAAPEALSVEAPRTVTVTDACVTDAEEAPPRPAERTRRPDCWTVLLAGLDRSGGGSDVNLLVRFDAPARRIDAVSLPRDTLLHHEWYSNRLNYAYASGGTELLRAEVENLLGVPVDYCVTIGLDGFAAFIDRIGGVTLDVPVDMDYDDPAQGLHIHYARGRQRLSGQQALEVVRWRKNNDGSGYPDADLGRIRTQQAFLRAAAEQAARPGNVPALARAFSACVSTDLSPGNLAWLALRALDAGTEGLRFHTLPGDGAGVYRRESVYVLDPEATLALVNEALDPYDGPITADELDVFVP